MSMDAGSGEDSGWTPERAAAKRQERAEANRRKMRIWLIGGCIIAAVLSFAVSMAGQEVDQAATSASATGGPEMTGFVLGTALGSALFIALPIFLVIYLAASRRFEPDRALVHLGFLALAAAIGAFPGAVMDLKVARDNVVAVGALNELAQSYDERILLIADRDNRISRRENAAALLQATALGRPGGVARAQQATREMAAINNETWTEIKTLQSDLLAEIEAIEMPDALRTEVTGQWHKLFDIDRQIMELYKKSLELQVRQLNILARQPRRWRVIGGQIAFERQSELDAFNAIAVELQGLEPELTRLQHEARLLNSQR